MQKLNHSILDNPLLLQFIFFPRPDWSPVPDGAIDHYVRVAEGISVFCRFYPVSRQGPTILYFHGNGEVVCDHDWIARLYNEIGVNLFVADYRGYGSSGGVPSFSNTASDAHIVFGYLQEMLKSDGYTSQIYIRGCKLSSQSIMDLAAYKPNEIAGLILVCGFLQDGLLFGSL